MELGVVVHVQKHPLCSEKDLFSNGLIFIKLGPGHCSPLHFSCKQTKVMCIQCNASFTSEKTQTVPHKHLAVPLVKTGNAFFHG